MKRKRMIFDLSPVTQMAIRLRAVKGGMTTRDVVEKAVRVAFRSDFDEATKELGKKAVAKP